MLGGAYLCFEGAEKIFHMLFPHGDDHVEADLDTRDPARLEEARWRARSRPISSSRPRS